MSARRVAWLLAAGVLVIAFAIWLSSQRHLERATQSGDLVLPGLEHSVNSVTQLALRKGDGTQATIKRSGEAWSVGERGWPADVSKLRKLLLALGALNVVEEKTRLPANYASLGVEDVTSPKASGTRVEASAPGRSWALIVGKSSNAKSGYVRVAGAAQSLLAAPLLSVDADPKSWLDHALADLAAERVRQVEEKPGQGPAYSVSRDKKDAAHFSLSPLPKGRELIGPGSADGIPAALSALTLDDAHKAAGGGDAHAAHAVFRTFDGLEVEVTGRKDGTRSLLTLSARASASAKDAEAEAAKLNARVAGWEFDVPEYKYTAIFTPLDELLKKPPEAQKKPSGASKSKLPRTPAPATSN